MKTKEKAKELVDRFLFNCRECDFEDNARQSALIAVDEIIVEIYLDQYYSQKRINYWQEVKQEIHDL